MRRSEQHYLESADRAARSSWSRLSAFTPTVVRWWSAGRRSLPPPGAGGRPRVRHTAIRNQLFRLSMCAAGGFYLASRPLRFPVRPRPATEAAGVVESVGEGVTDVATGDRVAYAGMRGEFFERTRCLCAGAQRSGGAPDQASGRHIRPASGGDVGERVHRLVDHQPNLPAEAGRPDP